MTKMTYTMVKAMVQELVEKRDFWGKMADTYRPFSYRWQDCTNMATEYNDKINEIFANNNPSYKTMFDLETSRKRS